MPDVVAEVVVGDELKSVGDTPDEILFLDGGCHDQTTLRDQAFAKWPSCCSVELRSRGLDHRCPLGELGLHVRGKLLGRRADHGDAQILELGRESPGPPTPPAPPRSVGRRSAAGCRPARRGRSRSRSRSRAASRRRVGSSGIDAARSLVVTQGRAPTGPDMLDAPGKRSNMIGTWPPMTSTMAGPPPL